MFATDDTIVAISTPLGRAGIGVVRVSGPEAAAIAQRLTGRAEPLKSRVATFATITAGAGTTGPGVERLSSARPGPADPSRAGDSITPADSSKAERSQKAGSSGNTVVRALVDHAVVTFFPAPNSYTGEHVVEISAHGSPVILRSIIEAAMSAGARLAEPGEFTLRAFLNGKLDLIQAEAVADLIDAATPLQARAAFDQLEGTLTTSIREIEATVFDLIARLEASLDFPDEGYHFVQRGGAADEVSALRSSIAQLLAHAARGRLIREGAQIAIVGTPNVGKSSLFNALLNTNRAIVTPIPGTTRDLLAERAEIGGLSVSLVDTAGIRESASVIEQEGVSRARQAVTVADLTVLVLDRSRPLGAEDRRLIDAPLSGPRVVVVNKIDLPDAWRGDATVVEGACVSVKTGEGVAGLVDRMAAALGAGEALRDQPLVSNVRHGDLLRQCDAALARAADALSASNQTISEEFILADLQEAAAALQEITGQRTTDDLLAHIFSRFCIGK
ncbi:MAG TPA: tRNA uridine-5-carboxymethylaminomethyl(34) synthesis GTPase MnmE [Vicinamibacterales bacterium]|nr:tRNA uridine-5-carboxymethylaminomethyl(34) synthesis GTPase MnmE [Vicinamibacterales bacterium]